ncbi:MAG TPA: hypothetical protein VIM53_04310 [Candidatus Saccharimonadales bacterium]
MTAPNQAGLAPDPFLGAYDPQLEAAYNARVGAANPSQHLEGGSAFANESGTAEAVAEPTPPEQLPVESLAYERFAAQMDALPEHERALALLGHPDREMADRYYGQLRLPQRLRDGQPKAAKPMPYFSDLGEAGTEEEPWGFEGDLDEKNGDPFIPSWVSHNGGTPAGDDAEGANAGLPQRPASAETGPQQPQGGDRRGRVGRALGKAVGQFANQMDSRVKVSLAGSKVTGKDANGNYVTAPDAHRLLGKARIARARRKQEQADREREALEPVALSDVQIAPDTQITPALARKIRRLESDDYDQVVNDLTPEQQQQYMQVSKAEAKRLSVGAGVEFVKRHRVAVTAGAVAVAGVTMFLMTRGDTSHLHHVGSGGGHASATPQVTPTGAPTHTAPSTVVIPTAPSGGWGHLLQHQSPGQHLGSGVITKPPLGGGTHAAPPSVEHAIQINNAAEASHHGQAVWTSLHEAGFSDHQIGNAVDKATQPGGPLEKVTSSNGGFYLRLKSNGSSSPDAVMSALKNFMS